MKKITKNYLIGGIVGLLIGTSGMGYYANYHSKPKNAYSTDLNRDGIQDLVLTNQGGMKYALIGKQDGTFKLLDELEKEHRQWYNKIKAKIKDLEEIQRSKIK